MGKYYAVKYVSNKIKDDEKKTFIVCNDCGLYFSGYTAGWVKDIDSAFLMEQEESERIVKDLKASDDKSEANQYDIESYRKYNPYTEAIIKCKSGSLIVIDRYGVNDYGAWWTDEEHLYDEFFGSSVRGNFASIMSELKDEIN